MKYFCLPNLSASAVTVMDAPWTRKFPGYPPEIEGNKMAYMKWVNQTGLQGCFLSMAEGVTKELRISQSTHNDLHGLWGTITDYDAPMEDTLATMAQRFRDKPRGPHMPQWICRTFSGQSRAVWEFPKISMFVNPQHFTYFMSAMSKRLKLDKWMPGLEASALGQPNKFYEWGREWYKVSGPESRIPEAILDLENANAAAKAVTLATDNSAHCNIPIEEIAKAVFEKYPGRWEGPFALGSQGVRFWDPDADNKRAALVTPEGMLCFTGPVPFMSWSQLFGAAFVDSFEAAALSAVVNKTAYDGRTFWCKDARGDWFDVSKEDFKQRLMFQGHSASKSKGKTCSKVDEIEVVIKETRRVTKAMPFLFFPEDIIWHEGKKFLNISSARPQEPVDIRDVGDDIGHWNAGPKYFPFIHKLLMSLFCPVANGVTIDMTKLGDGSYGGIIEDAAQMEYLLAYLQFAYVNAYNKTPKPGQCMLMAGGVGKGKTLFNRRVLGALLGGYSEASGHLVGGSTWTEELVANPVMCIDDSLGASDHRKSLEFAARIKMYVANASIVYDQKYMKSGKVPWFGRISITCNLDAESMRLIPQSDISMKDKLMLFKCSDGNLNFPSSDVTEPTIAREMPYFARFLMEWKTPAHCVSVEKRFGVRSYLHPELYDESLRQGLDAVLLELLDRFLKEPTIAKAKDTAGVSHYVTSVTQLYNDLATMNPGVMRDIRPRQMAICLGNLEKNGYNIHKVRSTKSKVTQYWRIGWDLVGEDNPKGG